MCVWEKFLYVIECCYLLEIDHYLYKMFYVNLMEPQSKNLQ